MKIRKYIYLVILILWMYSGLKFTLFLINDTHTLYLTYSGMSEEEKLSYFDGNFYSFMRFCQTKIPSYSRCIFVSSFEEYIKIVGEKMADFFFRVHKEKSGYYLYPILVYSEPRENLDFSYVIVFNGNFTLPSFELFAQFSPTCYILKRKVVK